MHKERQGYMGGAVATGRDGRALPRLGHGCTAPMTGGKQRKRSTQKGLQQLFSIPYAQEISFVLNLAERGT